MDVDNLVDSLWKKCGKGEENLKAQEKECG